MNRVFLLALAITLATLPLSTASAHQQAAGPDNDIIQRLDNILNRVELLDTRLKKLEDEVRVSNQWWVDKHGIMRAIDGRPIGFWGVDDHPVMSR